VVGPQPLRLHKVVRSLLVPALPRQQPSQAGMGEREVAAVARLLPQPDRLLEAGLRVSPPLGGRLAPRDEGEEER
jgi:hypothetical protein